MIKHLNFYDILVTLIIKNIFKLNLTLCINVTVNIMKKASTK